MGDSSHYMELSATAQSDVCQRRCCHVETTRQIERYRGHSLLIVRISPRPIDEVL